MVDQERAAQIAADPGMDVDMIDNSDVELKDLLNVITRDAADEIGQHEKMIL